MSTDNVSWNLVQGDVELALQAVPVTVQSINLGSVSGRYVRLDLTENHGSAEGIGLGEVAFEVVPEPAQMAMIFGILAVGAVLLRRR